MAKKRGRPKKKPTFEESIDIIDNEIRKRRAKRKLRALNPLSLGLALALVAREQHLEMPEVIAMLEGD